MEAGRANGRPIIGRFGVLESARKAVSKLFILGWAIELAGMAVWIYGYFATGHPPIVDWHDRTPWWIADWLPNIESGSEWPSSLLG
jgi:hypothetical protein